MVGDANSEVPADKSACIPGNDRIRASLHPGRVIPKRAEHEVQSEAEILIVERWNWLTWRFAISPSLTHAIPEFRITGNFGIRAVAPQALGCAASYTSFIRWVETWV
jgi:hypothetical protein